MTFIQKVAKRQLVTNEHTKKMLNAIIETIKDELNSDAAKCKVPGLGTFKKVLVKERSYFSGIISISTIPEHYEIRFQAESDKYNTLKFKLIEETP